jgi:DNA primase
VPAEKAATRYTGGYFGRLSLMSRKIIGAVKDAVPIEEYAGELTELRRCGYSLRGRCPVHNGSNPHSFVVTPKRQMWHCFGCNEGGDVLDLYRAVEGGQLWEAVQGLALRYNVELPQRPPSWYRRQGERVKIHERVVEALARGYQRRFFRVYGDVILEGIEDEDEREEEARKLFEDFRKVGRYAARAKLERKYG